MLQINEWNKGSQKMYASSKVSWKYWEGSCPHPLPLVSYTYLARSKSYAVTKLKLPFKTIWRTENKYYNHIFVFIKSFTLF